MIRSNQTIPAAMVAAACLVWGGAVWAHSGLGPDDASDLEALTENANLIAHGTVVGVEYVNYVAEEVNLPYTRVTYQLTELLRGQAEGDSLTLQFVGGADGQGGFVFVSGVPTFQKGDEDILFVRGNGEDGDCPLVHCEYGRFRIHQSKVYNTHGQPLRGMKGNNTIARGKRAAKFQSLKVPAPKFDDLMKSDRAQEILKERGMSVEQARAEYAKSAPKEIEMFLGTPAPYEEDKEGDKAAADPQDQQAKREAKPRGGGPPETRVGAEPISKESFVAKIKGLEKKAKRKPAAVKSARKGVPVKGKRYGVASPGKPDTPEPRRKQATPEDEAEAKALEAQGGDPVMKSKKPKSNE